MKLSDKQLEARRAGGRIGGKAKVKKGFAMVDKQRLRELAKKGGSSKRNVKKS